MNRRLSAWKVSRWQSFIRLLATVAVVSVTGAGMALAVQPEPAPGSTGVSGNSAMRYAIAIHGGAGSSPDMFNAEGNRRRRESMEQALTIGVAILKQGGSALDAVEQVVIHLENDPQFNAGVGAVFNAAGGHELDAAIMDGNGLRCGAVAGVSRIRNPIALARRVMTDSPHVLMAGAGAEEFATGLGLELVDPAIFDTPRAREAWEKTRAKQSRWKPGERLVPAPEDIGSTIGTVGCVALDNAGNLAAATSTGGMSNKRFGRIGDSPIIGAGTYADNATAAISCTGTGEEFIRHTVAASLAARVRYTDCALTDAVRDMLTKTLQPDDGGIIAVGPDGEIVMEYNSRGMARAAANGSGRFEVLWDEAPPPAGQNSR
jgi:L-asparaginase / beta-aspartyl-peptidase